jgi:recombinational DNA repair protein (RecF pathway)
MSTETCVVCGKKIEVVYYKALYQGKCRQCTEKELKNYHGKLGDTTGDTSNGYGCYDHDKDF